MMPQPIISVSGLRGVIGHSLTPDLAVRYAAAFAAQTEPGTIVLTRDGRATGGMLADAIRASLVAMGRAVVDAGVAATPTTGVLIRQYQGAGGIQVSASHNPAEYNGMKLFGPDGSVLTETIGQGVRRVYESSEYRWAQHDLIGTARTCPNSTARHLELVLANIDVPRVRGCRFHVLLDSNHGAGSLLGCLLLRELNCSLTLLGAEPDGQFSHPPEPIAENLTEVGAQVVATGAAVGFCQDPDADRLAVIDANGVYLGEEYTLALCVDHALRGRKGPIVTNCSTSRMSADLAQRHGVPLFRSKVGEAHVVELMKREGAAFGGEGNGGPIDPRVGFVRDSFVGMAMILDAMAARNATLRELADAIPRYAIHKSKMEFPTDRVTTAWGALADHFAQAKPDRLDGLRLDWPDRWLLIRASNTEPVVRIVAEASQESDAIQLCQQAEAVLRAIAS